MTPLIFMVSLLLPALGYSIGSVTTQTNGFDEPTQGTTKEEESDLLTSDFMWDFGYPGWYGPFGLGYWPGLFDSYYPWFENNGWQFGLGINLRTPLIGRQPIRQRKRGGFIVAIRRGKGDLLINPIPIQRTDDLGIYRGLVPTMRASENSRGPVQTVSDYVMNGNSIQTVGGLGINQKPIQTLSGLEINSGPFQTVDDFIINRSPFQGVNDFFMNGNAIQGGGDLGISHGLFQTLQNMAVNNNPIQTINRNPIQAFGTLGTNRIPIQTVGDLAINRNPVQRFMGFQDNRNPLQIIGGGRLPYGLLEELLLKVSS